MCHFAKPEITLQNLSGVLLFSPQCVLAWEESTAWLLKGANKTLDSMHQQVPMGLWGHRCLSFTPSLELSFPEMTSVTPGPCEKGRPRAWLTQVAAVEQSYLVA